MVLLEYSKKLKLLFWEDKMMKMVIALAVNLALPVRCYVVFYISNLGFENIVQDWKRNQKEHKKKMTLRIKHSPCLHTLNSFQKTDCVFVVLRGGFI